ncbi:Zinc finger and BTB domain-containing protein 41 [Aphelenchoides besseyi]|nr:Zinc finger and BTB domain-containing protein 41 [Aphelenchoides besseyi]
MDQNSSSPSAANTSEYENLAIFLKHLALQQVELSCHSFYHPFTMYSPYPFTSTLDPSSQQSPKLSIQMDQPTSYHQYSSIYTTAALQYQPMPSITVNAQQTLGQSTSFQQPSFIQPSFEQTSFSHSLAAFERLKLLLAQKSAPSMGPEEILQMSSMYDQKSSKKREIKKRGIKKPKNDVNQNGQFKCPVCGKMYKRLGYLKKTHLPVHDGMFECKYCNRVFTDKPQMREHERCCFPSKTPLPDADSSIDNSNEQLLS